MGAFKETWLHYCCPWIPYPVYKVGPRGQNGWQLQNVNESSGPDIIVSGFFYHEQV